MTYAPRKYRELIDRIEAGGSPESVADLESLMDQAVLSLDERLARVELQVFGCHFSPVLPVDAPDS